MRGSARFDLTFYQTDPDGGPVDEAGFAYRIPWQTATRKIELWLGSARLASLDVSLASPQVTVLGPNGGEIFDGNDAVRMTWMATDADSQTLTYNLALSQDDGESWVPLAMDLAATTFDIPARGLAPGSYLLRVTASDGVNAGADVSNAAFLVQSSLHLPLIRR